MHHEFKWHPSGLRALAVRIGRPQVVLISHHICTKWSQMSPVMRWNGRPIIKAVVWWLSLIEKFRNLNSNPFPTPQSRTSMEPIFWENFSRCARSSWCLWIFPCCLFYGFFFSRRNNTRSFTFFFLFEFTYPAARKGGVAGILHEFIIAVSDDWDLNNTLNGNSNHSNMGLDF